MCFDDYYKFYFGSGSYVEYDPNIASDSWNQLEFVSKNNKGDVLGYFKACVNNKDKIITSFVTLNFSKKPNLIFAKDLRNFFISLFTKFGFRKINFLVIVGNPIEKNYDKMMEKYGGRIVGIKKEQFEMFGDYYDVKEYEILKTDYLNSNRK